MSKKIEDNDLQDVSGGANVISNVEGDTTSVDGTVQGDDSSSGGGGGSGPNTPVGEGGGAAGSQSGVAEG